MNEAKGLDNGVMMDKQIIFEDEQIRVIFLKGSSAELIFSFGDLITRAKGLSVNAEKSLHKFDFNVIGIMPKQKSWFPESSILAMMDSIQPVIAPFKARIAYGGSMGGYAAIKYSICWMCGVSSRWCRSIRLTPKMWKIRATTCSISPN